MKFLKWTLLIAVAIQLIPYGRDHSNPPITAEPTWDSPATRALFKRACFDCHSNETVWPWYSHIAPVSWQIQTDVDGGREHLNFSEWTRPQRHATDVAAEVQDGEMPPSIYTPLHPAAKLTAAELQALIGGAEKSLGPQQAKQDHRNPFQPK